MLAFKYPARQETSVVENIIVQVGRTGALTPVALIKPVEVGGVIVSRVTLHNPQEIERKDVRIGDTVMVQRAGDVIPEIVKVITEKRTKDIKKFIFPKRCPVCNKDVEQKEDEAVPRCTNYDCDAQVKERIAHFASKDAMNIDGLGYKIVEYLVDEKLIVDVADLYSLKIKDLESLEGFGKKSAENLIQSIESSKTRTFNRLIFGLGIRHVGETLAKVLANKFQTPESLASADIENLLEIREVGVEVAKHIHEYFRSKKNLKLLQKLNEVGVRPANMEKPLSNKLHGLTIVVTGSLSKLSRNEAHELIEKNGGHIGSSVTKKTSFLVVGNDAGSKLEKAKSLGVQTLTEDEFIKRIKD
jgi:DNA ligase (NAD+)